MKSPYIHKNSKGEIVLDWLNARKVSLIGCCPSSLNLLASQTRIRFVCTQIRSNSRPHGLCRAKRLFIVLREGAVRSKRIERRNELGTIGIWKIRARRITLIHTKIARERFELSTSRVWAVRSHQLSYLAIFRYILFNFQPAQLLWAPALTIFKFLVRYTHSGSYLAIFKHTIFNLSTSSIAFN